MKLEVLRIWGLCACGVALSCGKSNSTAGDQRGPAGAGGAAAGAGALSGAGAEAEGGAGQGTAGTPQGGFAGTASAGAGKGGSAGAPPLTDCTPGEPTLSESCTLTLHCAEERLLSVRCNEPLAPIGKSFCICSSNATSIPLFEVIGAPGGVALCEAAANYCRMPDVPEQCSWTVESRQLASCELELTCEKALANASGLDSRVVRRSGARCEDYGDGRMTCDCEDGRRFIGIGETGMEVCDTMFDVCAEESPVVFDGEITCSTSSESGGSGFCEDHPTCERAAELGDGVTVVDTREFDLSCDDKSSGGSACTCFAGGTHGYFDLESSTEGNGTCARFAPLCGLAEPIAVTDEIECALEIQGGVDEACFVQLRCGQLATFDGEQIVVYGTMWADCAWDGDDNYVCMCNAFDDSVPIEIEASSGWDACTAAATRCQDVAPAKIGDGVIRPPVPPPVGP